MNWILIVALVVLVLLVFKTNEVKHKTWTLILIALILFFIFTFSRVTSSPEVNFSTFDGIVAATKIYATWLSQVFGNVFSITGNAIKLDWSTNFSNIST